MHRHRLIWLILVLAVGLLLPATPALASEDPPGDDGIVIWNEDYTLDEGKRLDGDLVVFNGDVTLEASSHVEGSVIIWNGSAEIAGTVEGDVVVSSGDINLSESARVQGNVVCSWNCDLSQEVGAQVDGGIMEGMPLGGLRFEDWREPSIPQVPSPLTFWATAPGQVLSWTLKVLRGAIAILVIAAVAGLVALIWPEPTAQVGRTIVEAPWHSFGIGLLTVVAGTVLVLALAITICLSPFAVLVGLALGAAGLFGWAAVGSLVGERLLQAFNTREIAPLWAAGLGTLIITLIGMGLSAALCLAPFGWLLFFVIGCLGLGAVVLTRFGTTTYTPGTSTSRTPPPPPAPVSPSPVPTSAEAAEPADLTKDEAPEEPEDTEAKGA